MQEIEQAKIWPGNLVTQIEPLTVFYEAEPEHHDYFARNPGADTARSSWRRRW